MPEHFSSIKNYKKKNSLCQLQRARPKMGKVLPFSINAVTQPQEIHTVYFLFLFHSRCISRYFTHYIAIQIKYFMYISSTVDFMN